MTTANPRGPARNHPLHYPRREPAGQPRPSAPPSTPSSPNLPAPPPLSPQSARPTPGSRTPTTRSSPARHRFAAARSSTPSSAPASERRPRRTRRRECQVGHGLRHRSQLLRTQRPGPHPRRHRGRPRRRREARKPHLQRRRLRVLVPAGRPRCQEELAPPLLPRDQRRHGQRERPQDVLPEGTCPASPRHRLQRLFHGPEHHDGPDRRRGRHIAWACRSTRRR
jgi:hypothetical protein